MRLRVQGIRMRALGFTAMRRFVHRSGSRVHNSLTDHGSRFKIQGLGFRV
jgi:hypothetical protein